MQTKIVWIINWLCGVPNSTNSTKVYYSNISELNYIIFVVMVLASKHRCVCDVLSLAYIANITSIS